MNKTLRSAHRAPRLLLAAMLCLLVGSAQPVLACLETPTNPPEMTISGDACVAPFELEVRLHDYSTFAASNDFCGCALNLPLLVGQVVGASVVNAGTSTPIGTFSFNSDPDVQFNPAGDWQGFQSFVASAVAGTEVDLVFRVVPTKQRCEEFADTLANTLRDPANGFAVGTGGTDREGVPNHHVSVVPAGSVEVIKGGNADCPSAGRLPCAIDLQTGEVSDSCTSTAGLGLVQAPTDSDGDKWLETVLRLSLEDGCTQACVVLDYTERPTGFTLDFGDSPTNNGHGGNDGGSEAEAEVQIAGETMTAFSIGLGAGQLDRTVVQELALANSSYKVCVSNQTVTFGQPSGRSTTPFGQELFALPDPFDGNRDVFIGLNRVIKALGGAPSPANRTGTGLRRAYIAID